MKSDSAQNAGVNASQLAAFVLAALVHGATVVLALLGVWLLVAGRSNLVAIAAALICLGIAWVLRPRVAPVPRAILSRASFPALYGFVDSVSQALKAPRVAGIVVNPGFNASIQRAGWRQEGFLTVGLPLWTILEDDEKVALVAHEIAHTVNGDPVRGLVIGNAISSLVLWHDLLRPNPIWRPESGLFGLLLIPWNLLMLGAAKLAWLAGVALAHLLWRDKQRTEYRADYLAATIAGDSATVRLFEKLHFARAFDLALQRSALGKQGERDFFEELKERMRRTPARELERIRRVQLAEQSRLNVTHPPLGYRIEHLQAMPAQEGSLRRSGAQGAEVERELATLRPAIQRHLLDRFEASLYY